MPDYSKIIKNSIRVIRDNKWLLVLGVLAGGGGSTSSLRGRGIGDFFKDSEEKGNFIPEDIQREGTKVLGEASNAVLQWFSSIPPFYWMLIFLAVILFTIAIAVFSLVYHAFVKSALIAGVDTALKSRSGNLVQAGKKGRDNIKNMILLGLISSGILLVALVLSGLFSLILYIIFAGMTENTLLFMGITMIVTVIPLVVIAVVIAMVAVYAERLVVLNGLTPIEAWKKGFSLAKGDFLNIVITGFINALLTGTFGCLTTIVLGIVLGIPGLIVVYPHINGSTMPGISAIVFLGILAVIFLAGQLLVGAISNVFKFSNWNQIFNEALRKSKK